ncbi:sarcosine oxidase subunit delta [Ferrimonas balearica]|nr:sarcosine oxidase subunit delta [Ferrimonas balearica]
MRLTCPLCGERDLREFTYRGAALARPEGETWGDDWHDYIHLRDNPAGENREYWAHSTGCAAVLLVTRDTRTHEVLGSALAKGGGA